jgi:ATP-binding cassette subfamily B protein
VSTHEEPLRAERSLLDLLRPEDRAQLLSSCESMAFSFGDVVMRQGDEADSLFVLVSGRARVVQTAEGGEELVLGSLGAGDVVGETALLQGGRRMATVRASGDVSALRLDRSAFERLRQDHPAVVRWLEQCSRARLLFTFLKRGSALSRLPGPVIRDLVRLLTAEKVSRGQVLIREGEPPGPMYLIEKGRFRVDVAAESDAQEPRTVGWLRAGDVAGEISLLKGVPRTATVEALTDGVVLVLQPDQFHELEERWPEFRHAVEERLATYDYEAEARLPLDFAAEVLPAAAQRPSPLPEEGGVEEAEAEEEAAGPGRRRRARRRFPFVRQVDEADCGVACLSMICRNHGKSVPLAKLRSLAHTATDGTTLRNLCHAGEELGLAARPLRVSRSNLDALPLPAILHWEGNHWVVLVSVGAESVRIADPAVGVRRIPREELFEKWNGYAATFEPTPAFRATDEGAQAAGWIWDAVRPHVGVLAKAVGLSVVAALLAMLLPILTQVVVDRVVVEGASEVLYLVLVGMGAIFVFRTLSGLLQGYLVAFVAVRLDASILDFLARRLLALPLSYFLARRAGDIQRRLDGARQVRQLIVSSGVNAVLALIQVSLAVVIMAVYSLGLTAWFLLVLPVYGVLTWTAARFLRRTYEDVEASLGRYRSDQLDAIKGIEAVKASSAEPAFRESLLQRFLAMARQQFRADLAVLSYQSGVEAAGFLTSLLFLYLGAQRTIEGELTLGAFVAFLSLVSLAITPLRLLLWQWDDWQFARVLLARLRDVVEAEPEQGWNRERLLPVRSLSGAIELRGVTFRYGGPESRPVLNNLSLKVPAGQTVAVVGRSGSGKTTLIKLLSGLLEPSDGQILFDGIDLRTLNYRDLRQKLGFVLQDTHLFAGSVQENITLGCDASLERVVAAARAAHAHEFIEQLPLGYETQVGETGVGLSGGQAQRVAIARAIYRNPVVLIFDEATSALDAESERAILENMGTLFEGRTVFVIAHRLSTVRDADWTIVLEQGEIVEQGTHDELMDRRGLYFYLVSRQVGT